MAAEVNEAKERIKNWVAAFCLRVVLMSKCMKKEKFSRESYEVVVKLQSLIVWMSSVPNK